MYAWQWIALTATALAFLMALAVLGRWRARARSDGRNAGRDYLLAPDLRRGPGESLREPMSATAWSVARHAALAVFAVPFALGFFPLRLVHEGVLPGLETSAAFLGALALLELIVAGRLWRLLARSHKLALGYEAEVVAGQELENLRHLGYRVFHDVPAGTPGESLDHVIVGPAGVFAVTAKGRAARRPRSLDAGKQEEPWEVTYDGERLKFPGWEETLPLGQAMDRANWLFEWLHECLGEPVNVRPILVLPGWSVKRTAVSGIPVLAAHRIQAYFARMKPLQSSSEDLLERICEQLEERCRVVAVPDEPPPSPTAEGRIPTLKEEIKAARAAGT